MNKHDLHENIKDLLKSEIVTSEGEIIELHEQQVEKLSKNIYKEIAKKNTENKEHNKKVYEVIKDKTELENNLVGEYGRFYFNFYNNIPCVVLPQYKFRFIYLCTYLQFNNNKLVVKVNETRSRNIKESELQELLKLSNGEYYKTKNELIKHQLIKIDENQDILINKNTCVYGDIGKAKNKSYIRVFKDSIQYLYNSSHAREHKKLALFINLLPYINFNYNIICTNPMENIMENITPLDIKEIADITETYKTKTRNYNKLKKQLLDLELFGEKLLLIIEKYDKRFFAVNPRLYYKGNKMEDLIYLVKLFKI